MYGHTVLPRPVLQVGDVSCFQPVLPGVALSVAAPCRRPCGASYAFQWAGRSATWWQCVAGKTTHAGRSHRQRGAS